MKKTLVLLTTLTLLLGLFISSNKVLAEDDDDIIIVHIDLGLTEEEIAAYNQRLAERQAKAESSQPIIIDAPKECESVTVSVFNEYAIDYEVTGISKSGPRSTGNSNQTTTSNVEDIVYDSNIPIESEAKALADARLAERLAAREKADKEAKEKRDAEAAAAYKAEQEKWLAEEEEAARTYEERKAQDLENLKRAHEEYEKVQKEKELYYSGVGNSKTVDITLEEAISHSKMHKYNPNSSVIDVYDGVRNKINYAGGVNESFDSSELERLVFEKLNEYRRELGKQEMVRDDLGSREWAQVMASTGLFEHALLGADKEYGVDKHGNYFDYYRGIGENIQIYNGNFSIENVAQAIHENFNNSKGHHANRIGDDPQFTYATAYDIAIVRSVTGAYWIVERLAGLNKNYDPRYAGKLFMN